MSTTPPSSHGETQLRGLTLSELIGNVHTVTSPRAWPDYDSPPGWSRMRGGDSVLDVAGNSGPVSDVCTAGTEPDRVVAPRRKAESPTEPRSAAIAFCTSVAVSELSITRERHQASLTLLASLEEAQARGSELGSLEALLKVGRAHVSLVTKLL